MPSLNKSAEILLKKACTVVDFSLVKALFLEYAEALGIDLSFQNFKLELETMKEHYASPEGCMLLAFERERPIGCIGLRKFNENTGEIKRMYVKPEYRGRQIGSLLMTEILTEAKYLGYEKVVLDTLPQMESAIVLYKELGFKEIKPYRYNPFEGALFLEKGII